MNVSHGEYEKMLNVYKKSVQQSAMLARLQEITSALDHGLTKHLEDTFQFEPTGKSGCFSVFIEPRCFYFSINHNFHNSYKPIVMYL